MSSQTIHIPTGTHTRLRVVADARGISIDQLMDELATAALLQFERERQFRKRAAAGDPQRGVELLDKLDASFRRRSKKPS